MNRKTSGISFLLIILCLIGLLFVLVILPVSFNIYESSLLTEGIMALPALVVALWAKREQKIHIELGLKKIRIATVFACMLFMALMMPVYIVCNFFTMLIVDNTMVEATPTMLNSSFILILLLTGFYAPLCEEIAFRGVIYKGFRNDNAGWKAVIVSGFLFGLMHMNLNQFAYAFVGGMALALLYEATGSIWGSIIAHAFLNSINIIEVFLVDKFNEGYYDSVSTKLDLPANELYIAGGVYMVIGTISLVLALCVLKLISKLENRENSIKMLGRQKGKVCSISLVIGIVISVAVIVVDTILTVMA